MRKLASIQRVLDVKPIPNADFIVAYKVLGWDIIGKKDEFERGDLVVYLEIDSWVPHDLAPFLSNDRVPKTFNGISGNRIKTIKMKGQISQGLLLPLSVLNGLDVNLEEGYDLTEVLGIQKWEPPIDVSLRGNVRGSFPTHLVPKTDAERIQNLGMNTIWNDTYEVTEKLDGSSMTVLYHNGESMVCSRNLALKPSDGNAYWTAVWKYDIINGLMSLERNLAIQGEIIGPKIQQNRYNSSDIRFYVFNIWDIDKQCYLSSLERQWICSKINLEHVPIINPKKIVTDSVSRKLMLEIAEGKSYLSANAEREGLVYKSIKDPGKLFKTISNKFLLKNNN